MRSGEVAHAVEQAEEAQILVHRQIPRQRGVDGGEVRSLQSLAAVRGDIQALDLDRSRRRFENAEDHVDDRGLARAVGAEQPDDLVALDLERNPIHRHGVAVAFAQIRQRKHLRLPTVPARTRTALSSCPDDRPVRRSGQ